MGAAKSRNVTKSTMEAITNIATKQLTKTDLSSDTSQIISVKDITGPLDMSGITQKISAKLNINSLMTALSDSSVQTELVQNVTQSAKALVSGLNLGQFSDASNQIDSYVKAVVNMSTDMQNLCQGKINNIQQIEVEQVEGRVKISDLTQESVSNILSSCASDYITKNKAITSMQNTIDQKAEATSKGINPALLMFMALLFLILPVVVGGAAAGTIISKLLKMVFVLAFIAGVIIFILYFTMTKNEIKITMYSRLIGKQGECGGTEMETSTEYSSAGEAGRACENKDGCVAFDWQSVEVLSDGSVAPLEKPKTTFFSAVAENPCTSIQGDGNQDNMKLVVTPSFYTGDGTPPQTLQKDDGDIYIDNKTSRYWVYVEGDGWGSSTGSLAKTNTDISGVTIEKEKPISSQGEDGDWYLDTSNIVSLVLSKKTGGRWVENNTTKINIKTTNTTCEIDGDEVRCINVSGFKEKVKHQWMIIVGPVLMVVGFLGFIITVIKGKKGKKSKTSV